ncbi:hypothetical protein ACTFIZ_009199 [Dictyostelium cf. discoideum]
MVCNKDGNEELIIEYLNEYEQLTILRDQFNDNLKNGYFLISKSKYSMGQKSLGELQYPENMKSLFNVKIEDSKYSYDSKDDTFFSIQYIDNNKQAKSNNDSSISNNKNNNSKEQSSSSTKTTTTTTTRRRNVNSKEPIIKTSSNGVTTMGSLESLLNNCSTNDNSSDDEDDESDTDEEEDDDNNSFENNPNLTEEEKQKIFQEKVKKQQQKRKLKANKKIIRKDPIYWFGISTPTSLKQSQSYFKQAINQSIEISNKLIKMEIIYKKFWEQNS